MHILLIADPGIPVPPAGYGGIERVIAALASDYVAKGHRVTLMGSSGSKLEGVEIIEHSRAGFPAKKITVLSALFRVWFHLLFRGRRYDAIQNFGRLANLLPVWRSGQPKLMCYQRHIHRPTIQRALFLHPRHLHWIACSRHLTASLPNPASWKIVHNPFGPGLMSDHEREVRKSMVFLGRLDRIKGCHHAIAVAHSLRIPLIIAGNVSSDPAEQTYFHSCLLPSIDDDLIRYVGEVDDVRKQEILAEAGVLLFPIEWDEPFGIVMVEAMAQGTPVIAFNRGSAPEVIDHGRTGFLVESVHEMKGKVAAAFALDRSLCKQRAVERFSTSTISAQYLRVIQE